MWYEVRDSIILEIFFTLPSVKLHSPHFLLTLHMDPWIQLFFRFSCIFKCCTFSKLCPHLSCLLLKYSFLGNFSKDRASIISNADDSQTYTYIPDFSTSRPFYQTANSMSPLCSLKNIKHMISTFPFWYHCLTVQAKDLSVILDTFFLLSSPVHYQSLNFHLLYISQSNPILPISTATTLCHFPHSAGFRIDF